MNIDNSSNSIPIHKNGPNSPSGAQNDREDDPPVTECGCNVHADHFKDFKEFETIVGDYIKRAPSARKQYDNVHVASVYWQESDVDFDFAALAKSLTDVFRDVFGFYIKKTHVLQNGENPNGEKKLDATDIAEKFQTFLDNATAEVSKREQNNLFILHYAGHGGRSESPPDYFWQPTRSGSVLLKWREFHSMLARKKCDYLFLLDCCYAGAMMQDKTQWQRRCELLCAASANDVATAPGSGYGRQQLSFTQALTSELKEFASESGIDMFGFANHMRSNEVSARYNLTRPPEFRRLHDPRVTGMFSSILLKSKKTEHPPQQQDTESLPKEQTDESFPIFCERMCRLNELRVVFTLKLANAADRLLAENFEQMIHYLPQGIDEEGSEVRCDGVFGSNRKGNNEPNSKVKCHGIFKSDSTLAVLSMPIWMWDLLPQHPAYQSIGMARSDNLIPTTTTESSPIPAILKPIPKPSPGLPIPSPPKEACQLRSHHCDDCPDEEFMTFLIAIVAPAISFLLASLWILLVFPPLEILVGKVAEVALRAVQAESGRTRGSGIHSRTQTDKSPRQMEPLRLVHPV